MKITKKNLIYSSIIIFLFLIILIFYGAILRHHYSTNKTVDRFKTLQSIAVFLADIPFKIKNGYLFMDQITKFEKYKNKPKFKRYNDTSLETLVILPRYDGDKKIPVVEIIDPSNFKVIHSYSHNFEIMNKQLVYKDEHKFSKKEYNKHPQEYRNALVLNDGSLIAHSNYAPLFRLDICSNILWMNQEEKFRHKITLDDEGNIWTATEMYPYSKTVKRYIKDYGLFSDDAITKLDVEGNILFSKSVLEILSENDLADENFINKKNPIYINDVEPTLTNSEYWKKGDLFISAKGLSAIIHYRPSTNKVINYIIGPFFLQHDVNILSIYELSIFNNNNTLDDRAKFSEVLIYDFRNDSFKKKFNNQLIKNNFKTKTSGISRILSDGSLYVEEQREGRIIYFDKFGNKEWEFINVDKHGDVYPINWSRVIEDKKLIKSIINKINQKKC